MDESDGGAVDREPIDVAVPSELEELVPIFLANRRKDVDRLREAHAQGDWETIEGLGHSMKGMGGAYGFDPVTELGADLERLAPEGDAEAVAERIDRLEDYLARVRVTFTSSPS